MKYTNYSKIKKINFRYPEIMAKDADSLVKELFEKLLTCKDMLAEANSVADGIRKTIKSLEEEWAAIQPLIDVVYETEDREEIINKVNIGFKMGTEVNKNIF